MLALHGSMNADNPLQRPKGDILTKLRFLFIVVTSLFGFMARAALRMCSHKLL